MNSFGGKFLANAFREYIFVHDYHNTINFPYYFNIFQPEIVILEMAEYTFSEDYFDLEKMKKMDYNPVLSNVERVDSFYIQKEELALIEGESLIKISWKSELANSYVWIELDNIYDMRENEEGFEVTVEKDILDNLNGPFTIYYKNKN